MQPRYEWQLLQHKSLAAKQLGMTLSHRLVSRDQRGQLQVETFMPFFGGTQIRIEARDCRCHLCGRVSQQRHALMRTVFDDCGDEQFVGQATGKVAPHNLLQLRRVARRFLGHKCDAALFEQL